jgi:hypothetical protein
MSRGLFSFQDIGYGERVMKGCKKRLFLWCKLSTGNKQNIAFSLAIMSYSSSSLNFSYQDTHVSGLFCDQLLRFGEYAQLTSVICHIW